MVENITVIAQSAIRIQRLDGKIIYFDPFKINDNYKTDADYIFITHPHFDHFSPEDIIKIKKECTKIIAPIELKNKIEKLNFEIPQILLVNSNEQYEIDDIEFSTIPAYNLNIDFHKKEFNWVGYIVNIDNKNIYVAGDTDNIEEAQNVNCDIACVPIGGTYTMTCEEAVELIKEIKPNLVIPIHYKTIVGSDEDAYRFKQLLEKIVDVEILY